MSKRGVFVSGFCAIVIAVFLLWRFGGDETPLDGSIAGGKAPLQREAEDTAGPPVSKGPIVRDAQDTVDEDLEELMDRDGETDTVEWSDIRKEILSKLPSSGDDAELFISENLGTDVACAAISPDGAYAILVLTDIDKRGGYSLVRYSLEDGSVDTLIEETEKSFNNNRFSSDLKFFANTVRPGKIEIYDLEKGVVSATYQPEEGMELLNPSFSPDGKEIICSRRKRDEEGHWEYSLFVQGLDGGEGRVVEMPESSDVNFNFPIFSPDGKEIACLLEERVGVKSQGNVYSYSIGMLPADGGEAWTIQTPAREGRIYFAEFSPDGKHIAYTVDHRKEWGLGGGMGEIYIYSLEDGTEQKVTTGQGMFPVWLPDSSGVIFTSMRDTGYARVYSLGVPGGE